MAKVLPPVATDILDEETAILATSSEQLKKKIIHNLNFYGMLHTIGSIANIQINQVGVSAPNSSIWQLCDGSEIVDPGSPLRTIGLTTRFTPDYDLKFLRIDDTVDENPVGGSDTFNLTHDHGGQTTGLTPVQPVLGNTGSDRKNHDPFHEHGISDDLTSPIAIDSPAGYNLAPYMKIA